MNAKEKPMKMTKKTLVVRVELQQEFPDYRVDDELIESALKHYYYHLHKVNLNFMVYGITAINEEIFDKAMKIHNTTKGKGFIDGAKKNKPKRKN